MKTSYVECQNLVAGHRVLHNSQAQTVMLVSILGNAVSITVRDIGGKDTKITKIRRQLIQRVI